MTRYQGVPLLDLKAQYATIRAEIHDAINRVVESQHFILGPEVEALERSIALYSGCEHGIGVSSGTDAILASLMALDVGVGDEVITTPYTFLATVMSIARLGARAVLVDIDPLTYNIDASKVEGAITNRTKAIMPVHLYGQMADMQVLVQVAGNSAIPIIEDAAQAIGAEHFGRRAGSIGSLGCLSFFPSKNLGALGDAGMVLTNDAKVAERLRLIRNQGQKPKYYSVEVGGNFRLDAIQAAVLSAKLTHLDEWTTARQRNAGQYRKLFVEAGLRVSSGVLDADSEIALPAEMDRCRHVYNQFVIRVRERDALQNFLSDRRIGSEVYYPHPMHLQRTFVAWGYRKGAFPHSELAAEQSLAIPIYPELEPAMLETVVGAIRDFLRVK